jgi:hypothetical protein
MSPPKFNPVEPPWYGPVCPVVWEGRHREVSPYPDQSRLAAIIARSKITNFPVTLSRLQTCAPYPREIRFLSVLFRTIGPSSPCTGTRSQSNDYPQMVFQAENFVPILEFSPE